MRNINLLFSDAKDFLYNEVNRVFIAVILAGVILGYIIYSGNSAILKSNEELLKSNAELMQKMEKLKAQVDFRYFNTTRSLEDIHNVRIDTHYGDVRK
ncbi:MAG: hypothetical protein BHW55_09370 [Candidatus Melainabacteria bacterium 35_41]|jgi:hypothetical protein|nr:MAG: hypothetical protein BHW55_09370 [Candidatus Melainabacteria bacterium 35_41]